MQPKGKSVGKLYGSHSFESGPGRDKGIDAGIGKGNEAKGTMATGPGLDKGPDAGIGKGSQAKGTSSASSGTKGDKAGEDKAGMASGKSGKVKAD